MVIKSTQIVFLFEWLIVAIVAAPVGASDYSGLVVIGDSESDTGNVFAAIGGGFYPPSPPYFDGRFSNGPVWVDRLADHLGVARPVASALGGTNYAWAAATTGSIGNFFGPPLADMDEQVDQYLAANSPAADELFIVQGGANDFFQGQPDPSAPVAFISAEISELATEGARRFLVPNLTNDPFSRPPYMVWATTFNQLLSEEIVKLQLNHADISIGEFDMFGLEETILADPLTFGLTNVFDLACPDCTFLNTNPDPPVPNADEYFLWDVFEHRTGTVHQIRGEAAFDSLPAERIPLDIKPGSDPNSINLKSKGMLPVAILSTDEFDALSVDVSSLRFGDSLLVREGSTPVVPLRSTVEDVNGDGLDDLSLKLSMRQLVDQGVLGPFSFAGSLTGATYDGSKIVGIDGIRIVGGGATSVPEPSCVILLGFGMLSLCRLRKRRHAIA